MLQGCDGATLCEGIVLFISGFLNCGEIVAVHLILETCSSISKGQTLRFLRSPVAACSILLILMAIVVKLMSFLNETFRFDFDNSVIQIKLAELLLCINSSIDCIAIT